jgi:hypothetical protein
MVDGHVVWGLRKHFLRSLHIVLSASISEIEIQVNLALY